VILEPKAQPTKLTPEEVEVRLAQIRARLPYLGPPVSIEAMDKAVTRMIRRDWRRLERQSKV
jgi:hypothetical protein